ncbi:MAG: 5'-nucleotidase C-terminal domain-containing protein [Treponema sp.]|jgi:5'-nucleotidase/UDP-sugar diphosphatase|nr:5'-nucleotidase C-terminal domain-containing protein [Treponema sp.]
MKIMKRFASLAALFLLIPFCLLARPMSEAGKTYELTLLHTNDHHGSVLPNGGRGGLAERAAFIKSVRAANANVLLIDAGDINTGPALSNMFAAEPDFLAYNLIGYDVATFGNHEFDGSQAKLERQLSLIHFPFVSSNIKTVDGTFLGGHQYLVKNYEGFRVGIFGITTLRTLVTASPDKSLTFIPEIKAALDVVDILRNREKVDVVIGITHIGDVPESDVHVTSPLLAASVPGIDIIVDGHSHSFFEAPRKVGDTFIVSSNEWGKYVGEGKLSITNGKLARFDWRPVEINNADQQIFAPDPAVTALLAPYIEKANASLKEVVGEASDTFIFGNRLTRYGETALGNMITDANVWYFKTVANQNIDFAFHNGGNMRAELPKGPLTRDQILTVLPFENYLFIVSLKGSQILDLFNYIAVIPQGNGGFPQFSKEVRYTIDVANQEIRDLTIGGLPVDPNKTYRFCTNDYLLGGGDGYTVLTRSQDPFNTSLLLSYVVIEYIHSQNGVITPYTDGRMQVIGGATP